MGRAICPAHLHLLKKVAHPLSIAILRLAQVS